MNANIIGIDLGGTQVRAGLVLNGHIAKMHSRQINAKGSPDEVLQQIFEITEPLIDTSIRAIGIGVPGLVDLNSGVVYDVVNIPSWKELPLQKQMEDHFQLPVLVNNDANCFALGEFYFGEGKGFHTMIGLTLGTGLGSGIIINDHLYNGASGGAGEFGMIEYLEHCYEYYASGQFFRNVHGISGDRVFELAQKGDAEALTMFQQMGIHLGHCIKTILFAYDVELIVLGGSVSKGYHYFSSAMWDVIRSFDFKRTVEKLKIEASKLENSGILGAAALHLEHNRNQP